MVQAIEFAIVKEPSVPRRRICLRRRTRQLVQYNWRSSPATVPSPAGTPLRVFRSRSAQNRHNVSTLRLHVGTKDTPPDAIYLPRLTATFYIHTG